MELTLAQLIEILIELREKGYGDLPIYGDSYVGEFPMQRENISHEHKVEGVYAKPERIVIG